MKDVRTIGSNHPLFGAPWRRRPARHFARAFFGSVACLLVAACSGGPSASDAEKAIATQFERAAGGAVTVTEIQGFELGGCKAAEGADGYVCDVQGTVVMDVQGSQQTLPLTQPVRFIEADGTWLAHRI